MLAAIDVYSRPIKASKNATRPFGRRIVSSDDDEEEEPTRPQVLSPKKRPLRVYSDDEEEAENIPTGLQPTKPKKSGHISVKEVIVISDSDEDVAYKDQPATEVATTAIGLEISHLVSSKTATSSTQRT